MLQRTPGTFLVSSELRGPAPLNTALARMNRILVALASLGPCACLACPAVVGPGAAKQESLADYTAIFEGEVVAVHLVGHEMRRSAQLQHRPWLGPDPREITPDFTARVLVTRNLQGTSPHVVEVKGGGCHASEPSLYDRGVFFVAPTGIVFATYESDMRGFSDYRAWKALIDAQFGPAL